MKNLSILSLAMTLMTSTVAEAADDLNLFCTYDVTGSDTNGLNISWAQLIISREDPVAVMILKYRGSVGHTGKKRYMDLEATDREYILTPNSRRDGEVSASLKKQSYGTWKAVFMSETNDSFSVLYCDDRTDPSRG